MRRPDCRSGEEGSIPSAGAGSLLLPLEKTLLSTKNLARSVIEGGRQRFDDRTTAGRHILFDHLLDSIEYVGEDHHPDRNSRWGRFTVDEGGVLQKVNRARRKRRRAAFSLSCRNAGIGLRSRLSWFDSKQGGYSHSRRPTPP